MAKYNLTSDSPRHYTSPPDVSAGAVIKAGVVNVGAGGTAAVTFATPFPDGATVRVTVTANFSNTDTSCTYSAYNESVNGFTVRGAGNPAGNVAWIATNAGNA